MSLAAVQARIAQLQGQFGVTSVSRPVSAPPTAPTATTPFAQQLSMQSNLLAGAAPLSPAATTLLPGTGTSAVAPAGGDAALGQRAVAQAQQHLGTPYVWGGKAPGGFDCSGLIQWSYKQIGIELPRVSRDQAKVGRAVSPAEARPGDLVFFDRPDIDHIGMYAGNGQWVVAPKKGDVVKMQDVDLSKATTIRRVTPDTAPAATAGTFPSASYASPATTQRAPYAELFSAAGARHGVSPALLTAVARAESGFNPSAQSPAGAQGLMQFMPATAASLGVDPWNPTSAVDGAARLLKQNLARFGSTELALAAYNAGPGAVTQHGGIPPYRETQAYVAKIMNELRGAA